MQISLGDISITYLDFFGTKIFLTAENFFFAKSETEVSKVREPLPSAVSDENLGVKFFRQERDTPAYH